MNTKGKIDFTKTDNIQFIEEVASEISKEDKNGAKGKKYGYVNARYITAK